MDDRDQRLTLSDGRILAWHEWGDPAGRPLLRLQGTPGSRLSRYYDEDLWRRLGLRVIMADRPGYGDSTRAAGRTFGSVADDLLQLLDHLGIERVHTIAGSGGGPHALALAARHPERIIAAGVVVGASPLQPEEVDGLIAINRKAFAAMEAGWEALAAYLAPVRDAILADPSAIYSSVLADCPPEDRRVMDDPRWQERAVTGMVEALRPGVEGWTDESMLMQHWDFEPEEVRRPVLWWHGAGDANAPVSAARRIADRLPEVRLVVWEDGGHMASFHHEEEILAAVTAVDAS